MEKLNTKYFSCWGGEFSAARPTPRSDGFMRLAEKLKIYEPII
jgi:hypothetical protein